MELANRRFPMIRKIMTFALCAAFLGFSAGANAAANAPGRIKPRSSLFLEFSPHVDVVMIGDSITKQGLWSEFVPEIKIANRGVGGDKADQILQRMDTILNTQPKVAYLMVGINDLTHGRSVKKTFNNIVAITEQLQQNNIKVVLQSTLECAREKCQRIFNKKVKRLNEALVTYANSNNIKFIDLNPYLSIKTGLNPKYTFDGMHLNGKGYRVWVDRLYAEGITDF